MSNALRNLRQKYDVIKRMVNDKEADLQMLEVRRFFIANDLFGIQKDMKRAEGEERAVSKDFGGGKQEEE